MPKKTKSEIFDVRELKKEDASFLNEEEKKKYFSFPKKEDALLFLGGRMLLRRHFGEKRFLAKENGKPYFEDGPYFSLSHSYPYICIAIDDEASIGIDIEKKSRFEESKVGERFDREEKKQFGEDSLIWCLKEAVYKAYGEGYLNLKERIFKNAEGSLTFKNETYSYARLGDDEYEIVLVKKGDFLQL